MNHRPPALLLALLACNPAEPADSTATEATASRFLSLAALRLTSASRTSMG